MNDRHDPLADSLSSYLDDLVSGHLHAEAEPPTDPDLASLQSSANQFHRLAHAGEAHASGSLPTRRSWESIMATSSFSPIPGDIPEHAPPRAGSFETRSLAAIRRWQPVVSMTIVVALLASVIVLTYHRGMLDDPDESGTRGAIPESTPHTAFDCVSNGDLRYTSEEIAQMSSEDWPAPEYVPVAVADPSIGQAVLDTYVGYYTCVNAYLLGSEERRIGDPLSDDMMSYQSDRYRFVMAPNTWGTSVHDVVPAETLEQAGDKILMTFPLPINRPTTIYWFPGTAFGMQVFSPGDVYELPDGRYGIMLGITSIATLRTSPQNVVEPERNLTFVAFVKFEGRLYIDEIVPICMGKPGFTTMEGTPVPTPVTDELQDSVVWACL